MKLPIDLDFIKKLDYWQAFLIKLILLYMVFHVLQLYFEESALGAQVNAFISNSMAIGASYLMQLFGYSVTFESSSTGAQMYIAEHKSVYINHSCNAFSLLKAFVALLLATTFKNKNLLWYLPLGIASIFVVNIIRIWALAIIYELAPDYLEINHKYVFTIVVYSWIFTLFLLWVNKFSPAPKSSNA